MKKTNATRLLESQKIVHEVVEYNYSEDKLDAVTVAESIGADPENVFKTLVCRGDKTSYCVFCIPGNYELNLKKAAVASGNKKVELIRLKELQPLTGYVHGGCSPLGMKREFPTFIDESAIMYDTFYVSAGTRGMQLKIDPQILKNLVNAVFCDLID
jgi:Cys-tRNA(Pro)/Cys-tRNA(Cys) deacylase